MKSEQGIRVMKWKGRKVVCERGHSVLFLMRCSSDISAFRGCLSTGGVAASYSRITSCGRVLRRLTLINVSALKSVLWRKEWSRCTTNPWHNLFRLCVRVCMCVISVADLLSAACLLMRGDLTDCPMWLIWRRAKLCSTPTARPRWSSENTI